MHFDSTARTKEIQQLITHKLQSSARELDLQLSAFDWLWRLWWSLNMIDMINVIMNNNRRCGAQACGDSGAVLNQKQFLFFYFLVIFINILTFALIKIKLLKK